MKFCGAQGSPRLNILTRGLLLREFRLRGLSVRRPTPVTASLLLRALAPPVCKGHAWLRREPPRTDPLRRSSRASGRLYLLREGLRAEGCQSPVQRRHLQEVLVSSASVGGENYTDAFKQLSEAVKC